MLILLIVLLYFGGLYLFVYLDARNNWEVTPLCFVWPFIIIFMGPVLLGIYIHDKGRYAYRN